MDSRLNDMHTQVLARMDRAERNTRWLIVVAAAVEAGLLGAFFKIMSFDQPTHWLILIAALLVYATLGIGLLALGSHANQNALRILAALEEAPDEA